MNSKSFKLKILVIEDNPGDALLLEEYLHMTELDFEKIMHCKTVKEALVIAESLNPDLIFLDLSLPDTTGIESFIQINNYLPHIAVIILSGFNDDSITVDTIAAGAQDYLVKGDLPVSLLQKSIIYSIERKKSQENVRVSNERFNAVSDASHDGIWDWNLQTNDFYLNEAMVQSFGYTKEDISRGYGWWFENVHPEDRDKANAVFHKALAEGLDTWQHEYRFICADRSVKHIFGRGIILRGSNKEPHRLIGIMQDITIMYELQQSLLQEQIEKQRLLAEATIEGQEKERRELGKELHDNINQLLAATKLYLSVAAKNEESQAEMINRSINNLNFCMEEIRKLSKALVPPSMEFTDLSGALHDLIEPFEFAGALTIDSNVEVAKNALSDKQLLNIYRIVQEQLNNIIKHARAKHAHINVVQKHGQIELIISDDGQGFDPNNKYEGIGLKNIQNRAEMLYGKMQVYSRKGKGCSLKIVFPVEHTVSPDLIPLGIPSHPLL